MSAWSPCRSPPVILSSSVRVSIVAYRSPGFTWMNGWAELLAEQVGMVFEEARSVQAPEHGHHQQIAGTERCVEPVGIAQPIG